VKEGRGWGGWEREAGRMRRKGGGEQGGWGEMGEIREGEVETDREKGGA